MSLSAYFLVGPTASGKSAVAQFIAEREGWDILSADSMLVYRGMDIGTDKPSKADRKSVRYFGLDLADPDEPFSAGDYVARAREAMERSAADGRQVIVVGGTGLYVKCLVEGLGASPPADPAVRAWAEGVLEKEGVAGLQKALRERSPERFEALRDRSNPRRLIRALELASLGAPAGRMWGGGKRHTLVGLKPEREALRSRIAVRVARMYESGLLDEVRRLTAGGRALSKTALQAIGYREALAVAAGEMDVAEAIRLTCARTRQLAKRQMTWFRHQADVAWVPVEEGSRTDGLADRVLEQWRKHGPTPVVV